MTPKCFIDIYSRMDNWKTIKIYTLKNKDAVYKFHTDKRIEKSSHFITSHLKCASLKHLKKVSICFFLLCLVWEKEHAQN